MEATGEAVSLTTLRTPKHHHVQAEEESSRLLLPLAFFLLGIGVLCPWNAFINARPYFESRLCRQESSSSTLLLSSNNIEVLFSILYNVASVLSLMALLMVQYYCYYDNNGRSVWHTVGVCHPLSCSLRKSSSSRGMASPELLSSSKSLRDHHGDSARMMVLVPLALYLAVFVGTTFLVFVPSAPAILVLYATLAGLFLCGVCTSVASAGIIGTAGLFADDAQVGVGPYFQGQAAGGLIVALMNAVAAWSDNPLVYQQHLCQNMDQEQALDERLSVSRNAPRVCVPYDSVDYSTGGYFTLNCVILMGCIMAYMYVDRKKNELNSVKNNYTPISDVSKEWTKKMDSTVSATSSEVVEAACVEDLDAEDAEHFFQVEGYVSTETKRTQKREQGDDHSIVSVLNIVKLPALAIFLTYLVTLSIFPVVTSDLSSVKECQSDARIRNDMFVPMTFLTFNLGDLMGRFVVADNGVEKHWRQIPRKLVWASLSRLAFIPIFFLCFSRKSLYRDTAIPSDLFSWIVQMAMAVTNGILTTVSFSVAAILVPPDEDMQQLASSIMNLSLCIGLVAGGLVASPLSWMFTGHW